MNFDTKNGMINYFKSTRTERAQFLVNELKGTVYVLSDKVVYIYDEEQKLFIKEDKASYYSYVCKLQQKLIEKVRKVMIDVDCDCGKKCVCGAQQLKSTLECIITDLDKKNIIDDIIERAHKDLKDVEFENRVNKISFLLPTRGGKVTDLRTGQERDRTKDDMFTFECNVSITKKTKHAKKFFTDVMPDEEERKYLQKQLGYIITGETDARCFFIWQGKGSNGKSVILNLIKIILNKFYTATSESIFCELGKKNANSASPDLYQLVGKRGLGFSEGKTSDKIEMNYPVLKGISGDDEITCRSLYANNITFKSIGKLIFATNHHPPLSNEESVKNRIRLVPFTQQFVENPTGDQKLKDSEFVHKLETKYIDEVFTWIVEGSIEYYKDRKIIMPESFSDKLKALVNQEDSIESFFNRGIAFTEDPKDFVNKKKLVDHYQKYCNEHSLRCKARSELFQRLDDKGYTIQVLHGYDGYRKIKIQDPSEEQDDKKYFNYGVNEIDQSINVNLFLKTENYKLKSENMDLMMKVKELEDIINKLEQPTKLIVKKRAKVEQKEIDEIVNLL